MNRPPLPLATARRLATMPLGLQLAIYGGAGIFFPALVWANFYNTPLLADKSLGMLAPLGAANLAAWYALSRLRTYARARLLSYVFPVNLITFGAVFAVIGLFRLDFSFSLFVSSFILTLAASYLVTARVRRANPEMSHFIILSKSIGHGLLKFGYQPLRSAQELETLMSTDSITGSIVADLHDDQPPELERLLARAALKGIPVYHYRLIEEMLTGEVRINHLRENDLGSLIPNLPYRTVKRALDVILVFLLSPILLMISGILAIAIKAETGGKVFFMQKRVGFGGHTFQMIKFRTMRDRVVANGTDARREDAITKAEDDRITGVGKYLRKTRMDEIPQAWNILLGDMSWIGPRPEEQNLAEWYEEEIAFYSYRHIVRPGITGWAQVNQGHVADLASIQQKLRFDFYYVKNLSLWLDVLIALKTLRVIVRGIGAR